MLIIIIVFLFPLLTRQLTNIEAVIHHDGTAFRPDNPLFTDITSYRKKIKTVLIENVFYFVDDFMKFKF
jgi:hypothetical protein